MGLPPVRLIAQQAPRLQVLAKIQREIDLLPEMVPLAEAREFLAWMRAELAQLDQAEAVRTAPQQAASAASAPSPTQVTVGPDYLQLSAPREGPVQPVAVDYWDQQHQDWVHFDFPPGAPTAPDSPAPDAPTARHHPPGPDSRPGSPRSWGP